MMKWKTSFNTYVKGVESGKIKLGKYAKAAVNRFNADLKSNRWVFDWEKADYAIRFIQSMPHIEGPLQGQLLALEPWQLFIVANLFGWVDKEGVRRFHEAYIEVPRKNGKSTLMAAIGNYMTAADNEMGAQVFAGATTLDQARKVFDPAWMMMQKKERFRQKAKIRLLGTPEKPSSIHRQGLRSVFKPMVGNPGDGDNPHCAIIDEYHEHQHEGQYKAMKTGIRARLQPMIIIITTAGMDLAKPCYKKHKQMRLLLDNTYDDDRTFAMIFGVDEEDEPLSLEAAIKANPNYGVSLTSAGIEAAINEAKNGSGLDLNYYLTKHLNVWVSGSNAYFNIDQWRKNKVEESIILEKMKHLDVYVGIDTASRDDITAVHFLCYDMSDESYYTFGRYFISDAHIKNAHNSVEDLYSDFVKKKEFIIVNDDDGLTDFASVANYISDLSVDFNIVGIVKDKVNWGVAGPEFYKYFDASLFKEAKYGPHQTEPLAEIKTKSSVKKFKHNGSHALEWMIGNAQVKHTGRGNLALMKHNEKDNHEKVDAVDAIIYAMQNLLEDNLEKQDSGGFQDGLYFA